MAGTFRRVDVYDIRISYVRGNRVETTVRVAHEDTAVAVRFLTSHKDYPGCEILSLHRSEENILVPPRGFEGEYAAA